MTLGKIKGLNSSPINNHPPSIARGRWFIIINSQNLVVIRLPIQFPTTNTIHDKNLQSFDCDIE